MFNSGTESPESLSKFEESSDVGSRIKGKQLEFRPTASSLTTSTTQPTILNSSHQRSTTFMSTAAQPFEGQLLVARRGSLSRIWEDEDDDDEDEDDVSSESSLNDGERIACYQ